MKSSGGNGTFGFGGGYTSIVSKIFDVWFLGLMWVVTSIPVITIGASTTALYYAMVKSVKNDDGYGPTMYLRAFKRNFKQATILWIIVAAVVYLMGVNTGVLAENLGGNLGATLTGFYSIVGAYALLTGLYIFPALSRFDMDTPWFLRVGLYMVARYILTSLVMLLVVATVGMLVLKAPVLILIVPGPACFLISEFMERVLDKHAPEGGKRADLEKVPEDRYEDVPETGEEK